MKTLTRNLAKSQAGFTLLELLIAMSIIAILVGIAQPKFTSLTTRAREANIKNLLGNVRSAHSIYYADKLVYPSDLFQALTIDGQYLSPVPPVAIPTATSNGNPGHPASTGVKYQDFADDDLTNGFWIYDRANGVIMINCTHQSTTGTIWSML